MRHLKLRESTLGLSEVVENSNETRPRVQLMQITPKYDEKVDEIQLYLVKISSVVRQWRCRQNRMGTLFIWVVANRYG